jgi:hypothetical protein
MRALLAALVASHGFAAHGVHCAVALPHLSGLVCAAAGVGSHQYDGRGVVRLLPSGRVVVMRSGSDVLLAVDARARRALSRRTTWRADGFACTSGSLVLTCRRAGHGFRLSATAFRRF